MAANEIPDGRRRIGGGGPRAGGLKRTARQSMESEGLHPFECINIGAFYRTHLERWRFALHSAAPTVVF